VPSGINGHIGPNEVLQPTVRVTSFQMSTGTINGDVNGLPIPFGFNGTFIAVGDTQPGGFSFTGGALVKTTLFVNQLAQEGLWSQSDPTANCLVDSAL
jgi:hypothetical protein